MIYDDDDDDKVKTAPNARIDRSSNRQFAEEPEKAKWLAGHDAELDAAPASLPP